MTNAAVKEGSHAPSVHKHDAHGLSRDPADWSTRVDSLVVVDSTLGDEDAEVCVIRVLQRVRWPAPQGGMTARIVWPFVFGR